MGKHGKRYTKEQKAEAVRLVRESEQPVVEVAESLGISDTALYRWVKQAKVDSGEVRNGPLTTEEQKEVRRLRRENQNLRSQNEFLKKVSAFFARENEISSR
jgi:transposase